MITRKALLRISGLSLAAAATRKLTGALGLASNEAPAQGTRWGMAIDTKKCLKAGEGCDKCISACHALHNVPLIKEHRHEVKWIWKEPFKRAFPEQVNPFTSAGFGREPVMVFCNHCENPPCVRVCPTKATWKRADGVVMMDWHRCIGCRYCVAACPYGSRSFNWADPRPHIPAMTADYPTRSKGVVEKCTFCEERLAVGRPPACVEVCPEKALVFGNLNDPASEVRALAGARYSITRKPELGTGPRVFYIL
jgi:molybdopterin-containing oxidoreductase family iron-sulfur binding subunit